VVKYLLPLFLENCMFTLEVFADQIAGIFKIKIAVLQ